MRAHALLVVLVAALLGGCVTPTEPTAVTLNSDGTVDLTQLQDGWPEFQERFDWAINKQENQAIITPEEREHIEDNLRDWWEALVIFDNAAELRAYRDNGWWAEFVRIVLWDADDRGDWRARQETEAYDQLTRDTLR